MMDVMGKQWDKLWTEESLSPGPRLNRPATPDRLTDLLPSPDRPRKNTVTAQVQMHRIVRPLGSGGNSTHRGES
jgi:hypothetical protein